MPLPVSCNIQVRVINVQCFRYPTTLYYRRVTAVSCDRASKFSHRATAARTILHTARSCCGLRTRPLLHLHSAIVTCDIGGVSETVNNSHHCDQFLCGVRPRHCSQCWCLVLTFPLLRCVKSTYNIHAATSHHIPNMYSS